MTRCCLTTRSCQEIRGRDGAFDRRQLLAPPRPPAARPLWRDPTCPALLVGGTRLVGTGYARAELRVEQQRRFVSGALLLTYCTAAK